MPPASIPRESPLRIIGIGSAQAAHNAERLAQALRQSGSPALALRARQWLDAPRVDGRVIALVEPAAEAAARQVIDGQAASVEMALARWVSEAETLLEWHRADPGHVLCLDAGGLGNPETVAALERWLQRANAASPPLLPGADSFDQILIRAAEQACQADEHLTRVHTALRELVAGNGANAAWSSASTRPPPIDSAPAAADARRPQAVSAAHELGVQATHVGAGTQQILPILRHTLDATQAELERTYLRLLEAEADVRSGRGPLTSARAELVRIGTPHRLEEALELPAELRQLVVDDSRRWSRVDVLLRLQQGQPSLTFLATGADPEVISAWQPDGSHRGRPTMSFVPARAEDRLRLQRMGNADWQTVIGVSTLLMRQINELAEAVSPQWHRASRLMQRQLRDIPARFRYDGLSIAECRAFPITACFEASRFGDVELGDIRLEWHADRLRWLGGDQAIDLPWTGWPIDADGEPADTWTFPLGSASSGESKAERWREMTPSDQALLLAVLDAMPAVASRASDATAEALGGRGKLAETAAGLLREAQAHLTRPSQNRRLARVPLLRRWVR